jgi:hypothetical protein
MISFKGSPVHENNGLVISIVMAVLRKTLPPREKNI